MKEQATKTKLTRLTGLNEKKIWRKKKTHQVRLIDGQECLHGVPDHDNGCGTDQPNDPLHYLTGLEHLHGLLAWVFDPDIVAQQVRS
jgi:hypothetical protein